MMTSQSASQTAPLKRGAKGCVIPPIPLIIVGGGVPDAPYIGALRQPS